MTEAVAKFICSFHPNGASDARYEPPTARSLRLQRNAVVALLTPASISHQTRLTIPASHHLQRGLDDILRSELKKERTENERKIFPGRGRRKTTGALGCRWSL